ncbi:MAG: hypothetical protein A3E01_07465 [Gammaproteobacteria bacterium RIFCSPHIGHO2_12_FULL_63_22]|nr:MAG: hypothetical protein A3E01_07465 [Gammaproteobacteria bacterium RIFCSPHIGHO2_12_FULL_63_22]
MKLTAITLLLMLMALAACSNKAGGGGSKNELAATACDAYAKGQLEDKTYQLDHAELAKSMADAGDGASLLRGPITIEPGLASESKQTLECRVRFVEGKDTPDVINMQFIW